ncbi:MAG TPA: alpha/beta fold hydrolase, partial [Bacteroidales bacterium]|nr:alpha/beta fold hydrolase [Bacteroidales bacterium]
MIHHDYKWKSFDGIMLYGQSWFPEEQPAAVINYVHGFKDHSNRFGKWAARLAENGYAVVAIDLRGHGRSEGRRGYAKSYNDFLGDIDVLLSNSRNIFKGLPHFLYGHSFGGNLVANYLIKGKNLPEAAVITSPWFTLTVAPSLFRMIMVQIIKSILPTITLVSNLDIRYLSRDQVIA